MIGYALLGTNNLEQATNFYGAVLAELGGKKAFDMGDRGTAWANGQGPMLGVCKPYDGGPATAGNGTMIALAAPDHETVDRVYAKAIALGASDEGAPGERMPTFYGAYFRDADGNKLCVFKMG